MIKKYTIPVCIIFLSGCAADNHVVTGDVAAKTESSAIQNQNRSIEVTQDNIEVAKYTNSVKYLQSGRDYRLNVNDFRRQAFVDETEEGITLEFENASINEVVALIIGKILKQNYIIDPSVNAQVTLRTTKQLNKHSVVYLLENILDIYNYRLVKRKGHFVVLPKNRTAGGVVGVGRSSGNLVQGYGYQVVPLSYITASEMEKILKSVADKSTIIRSHDEHNTIIIGGNSGEIKNLVDTISLFDINVMKNTNVALININYSRAEEILNDIQKIIDSTPNKSVSQNLIDIQAINRLNSLMVITRKKNVIDMIQSWVSELDIPNHGEGSRLYVYQVKNSSPDELVATLKELFSESVEKDEEANESVFEPGARPVSISNMQNVAKTEETPVTPTSPVTSKNGNNKLKIIAASDSNSILISATPSYYAKIKESLDKLDIPQLQVLIEVSIMDVRLTDEFNYGIQWFFESDKSSYTSSGQLGDDLNFPITFSYSAVKNTGDVRLLLNMLASDGKVDVLSSPSLLVRNNKKASIRIGDQQPITTAVVGQEGSLVATSVQFKDTGVILEIEPSVTPSGMVNVNISQEVTDVGDIDEATGQRAFLRRSLKSDVSVKNGETIVLGGLIRSNKVIGRSGVPVLKDIPLLGYLFGKTLESEQKTELVIMLTPRVIRDSNENTLVANEYKSKFRYLKFDTEQMTYHDKPGE